MSSIWRPISLFEPSFEPWISSRAKIIYVLETNETLPDAQRLSGWSLDAISAFASASTTASLIHRQDSAIVCLGAQAVR